MISAAGLLDGLCDTIEMPLEHRMQERLLVRVVLIQCARRYAGTVCHARGGQARQAIAEQNLNGRLEHNMDREDRPGLTRRLSWLQFPCRQAHIEFQC